MNLFKLLITISLVKQFLACHPDFKMPPPVISTSQRASRRGLAEASYEPLRIVPYYFDWGISQENQEFIQRNIVSRVIQWFEHALSVLRLPEPLVLKESDQCFDVDIPKEHLTTGVNGDILIYFLPAQPGESFVAAAGACLLLEDDKRPFVGVVYLNTQYFLQTEITEDMLSIIIHEMTHIFAFSSDLYPYFIESRQDGEIKLHQNYIKEVTYDGISNLMLTFPRIAEVTKQVFDCQDAEGMLLENEGGGGTVGSHWEKRLMYNDFMTGNIGTTDVIYSELTAALFEDSGWYIPNLNLFQPISWGRDFGCEFLTTLCYNHPQKPPIFCSTNNSPGCTHDYLYKGVCSDSDPLSDTCLFVVPADDGDCRGKVGETNLIAEAGEQACEDCRCVESVYAGEPNVGCFQISCQADTFDILSPSGSFGFCETTNQQLQDPAISERVFSCPAYAEVCEIPICPLACYSAGICNQGECDCFDNFFGDFCQDSCFHLCETCSGTGEFECTSCADGSFVRVNGSCLCPEGQTSDESGVCQNCGEFCLECVFLDSCIQCPGNLQKIEGGNCGCQEGQYVWGDSFEEYRCEECMDNCKRCEGQISCAECLEGFQWVPEFQACLSCRIPFCQTCEDFEICTACQDGFVLKDGKCESIPCAVFGCIACDIQDETVCKACQSGYRLSEDQNCQKCQVEFCDKCDSDVSLCTQCDSELILISNQCLQCQDPNCLICEPSDRSICKQCDNSYSLIAGSCQPCLLFGPQDGGSPKCGVCSPGSLINGICINCPLYNCIKCDPDIGCLQCASGLLYNGICREACPSGWVANEQECVQAEPFIGMLNFNSDAVQYIDQTMQFDLIVPPIFKKNQGHYYSADQSHIGVSNRFILNTTHSMQMWVMPVDDGSLYSLQNSSMLQSIYFVIQEGRLFLAAIYSDEANIWYSSGIDFFTMYKNSWYSLGYTSYTSGIGGEIHIFIDGVFIIKLELSHQYLLGTFDASENYIMLGGYMESQEFFPNTNAFIAMLRFANDEMEQLDYQYPCLGLGICLENCLISQSSSAFACQDCNNECPSGCVNPYNCNATTDYLCELFEGNNCLQCSPLANLIQGVCECILGASFNPNSGNCECETNYIEAELRCVCPPASYLEDSGCKSCSEGCQTCTNGSTCDICNENYEKIGDLCQSCTVSDCKKCVEGNSLVCEECIYGFDPESSGLCNPSPCLTGSCECEVRNCLNCLENHSLVCEKCIDGLPPNTQGNCCRQDNCEVCSQDQISSCEQCSPPYSAIFGKCQLCDIENCEQCTYQDPSICAICKQGAVFKENACVNCDQIWPNCTQCDEQRCFTCKAPYTLVSQNCANFEIESCQEYSNSGLCISCQSGFYLSPDGLLCLQACPQYYKEEGAGCEIIDYQRLNFEFNEKREVYEWGNYELSLKDTSHNNPYFKPKQGLYFEQGDEAYVKIEPKLTFSNEFTVQTWVWMISDSNILCIADEGRCVLNLWTAGDGQQVFAWTWLAIDGNGLYYAFAACQLNLNGWRHLLVYLKTDSHQTYLTIEVDGNMCNKGSSVGLATYNTIPSQIYLGGQYSSSGVQADIHGFISSFSLYEGLYQSNYFSQSGCNQQNSCLTSCQFLEFPFDSRCYSCSPSCPTSCTGASTCNFNQDPLCEEVDGYNLCKKCSNLAYKNQEGQCECIPEAYLDLKTAVCKCKLKEISPGICGCEEDEYVNISTNVCSPCSESCIVGKPDNICEQYAEGYTQGQCFTCQVPYCQTCEQDNEQVCAKCVEGYYVEQGLCKIYDTCDDQNCFKCDDPAVCQGCKSGFWLDNGQCAQCNLDNCTECSSGNTCTVCSYGYELQEGTCFKCLIDNCKECSQDSAQICVTCEEDHGLTSDFTCSTCAVENCQTCSLPYMCQTCQPSYGLTEDSQCSQCLASQVVNNEGFCDDCLDSNCLTCQKGNPYICSSCAEGYSRQADGSCLKCDVRNCLNCQESSFNCIECDSPTTLEQYDDGTSACICQGLQGCLDCYYFFFSFRCRECKRGYKIVSNKCSYICEGINCDICSEDLSQCETCKYGNSLTSDNDCQEDACQTENCLKCVEESSQCAICRRGYQLTEGKCVCQTEGCEVCDSDPKVCQLCAGDEKVSRQGKICGQCPTGLEDVEGVCGNGQEIGRFELNSLKQTVSSNGLVLRRGESEGEEDNDPLPKYLQGWYFTQKAFAELSPCPDFAEEFYIELWVNYVEDGIVLEVKNDEDIIRLEIKEKNLSLSVKLQEIDNLENAEYVESQVSVQAQQNVWMRCGIGVKFQEGTIVTLKIDQQEKQDIYPNLLFGPQSSSTKFYLGSQKNTQETMIFLELLSIYNGITPTSTQSTPCLNSGQCLTSCEFSQYLDPATNICQNCPSCPLGCLSSNCKLTIDENCEIPSDYQTCSICLPPFAIVNGICKCEKGGLYFTKAANCECDEGFKQIDGKCIEGKYYVQQSQVQSAELDYQMQELIVNFSVLLNPSISAYNCGEIFCQQILVHLGTNPQCSLTENRYGISVKLTNADIYNREICLNGEMIQYQGEELIYEFGQLTAQVIYPFEIQKPIAQINMISKYSLQCDPFNVEVAADEILNVGIPGLTYQWEAEPRGSNLGQFVDNQASASFIIAQTLIKTQDVYIIKVKVCNILQSCSETSHQFEVVSESIIPISLTSAKQISIYSKERLETCANIKSNCGGSQEVKWLWRLKSTENDDEMGVNSFSSTSKRENCLLVPANLLKPGASYTFEVQATLNQIVSTQSLNVFIKRTNIALAINRANGQHPSTKPISLNATAKNSDSFDSIYSWTTTCRQQSAKGEQYQNCAFSIPVEQDYQNDYAIYKIYQTNLQVGYVYSIKFKVEDQYGRTASGERVFEIIAGWDIEVEMESQTDLIQVHKPFVQEVRVISSFDVGVYWRQSAGPEIDAVFDSWYLTIQPNTLTAGQSYTFDLIVTRKGTNKSITQYLQLQTKAKPSFSTFTFTPSYPQPFTFITVQIKGSYTTQGIIRYQYGVKDEKGQVYKGELIQNPSGQVLVYPGVTEIEACICEEGNCYCKSQPITLLSTLRRQQPSPIGIYQDLIQYETSQGLEILLAVNKAFDTYSQEEFNGLDLALQQTMAGFDEITEESLYLYIAVVHEMIGKSQADNSYVIKQLEYLHDFIEQFEGQLDFEVFEEILKEFDARLRNIDDDESKEDIEREIQKIAELFSIDLSQINVIYGEDSALLFTGVGNILNNKSYKSIKFQLKPPSNLPTSDIFLSKIYTFSLKREQYISFTLSKYAEFLNNQLQITEVAPVQLDTPAIIKILDPIEIQNKVVSSLQCSPDCNIINQDTLSYSIQVYSSGLYKVTQISEQNIYPGATLQQEDDDDCQEHFGPVVFSSILLCIGLLTGIVFMLLEKRAQKLEEQRCPVQDESQVSASPIKEESNIVPMNSFEQESDNQQTEQNRTHSIIQEVPQTFMETEIDSLPTTPKPNIPANFLNSHLMLSLFTSQTISKSKKAMVLFSTLVFTIVLQGLLYYGSSLHDSQNSDFERAMDDYTAADLLLILAAGAMAQVFSVGLQLILKKFRFIYGIFIAGTVVIASLIGTVFLCFDMCELEGIIWTFGNFLGVILEGIFEVLVALLWVKISNQLQ